MSETERNVFPGETILSGARYGHMEMRVLQSAAGFYIGTWDEMGPVTRESCYFASSEEAQARLNDWHRAACVVQADDSDMRTARLRAAYELDLLEGART